MRRLFSDVFFFSFSLSLLSFHSLAMNHLSDRVSEMSREVKDEDVF